MSIGILLLIVWAWIIPEKEKYVPPLQVRIDTLQNRPTVYVSNDIAFKYDHNEAKIIIADSTVEYPVENMMSIATVVKGRYSDERGTPTPILAIAYANGDLEFYSPMRDSTDTPSLIKDLLQLDDPIVAMVFLDTTLIALTLNDSSYIDIHWIQHVNGSWIHSDTLPTQIQLSHVDTIFPLGEKGGFIVDNKNDVYFIDVSKKTITKRYDDVVLMNVLGSSEFYVLHYLTVYGTQYVTVNIADDIVVFEDTVDSREVANRTTIELIAVREQKREFDFSFSDNIYTVDLP